MLKKAKNVFILLFFVTELSEALQKKAISLLTGGAVDHLQTGNKSLKGRLSTWLPKNWRHKQELVQISYINSEKAIYNSRPKSRLWYTSTVLQSIKRSVLLKSVWCEYIWDMLSLFNCYFYLDIDDVHSTVTNVNTAMNDFQTACPPAVCSTPISVSLTTSCFYYTQ